MRSGPLLLLVLLHYLLLMHLHLQLLLLLLVQPHQLLLVPMSLHLVRIQIENFRLFLRLLFHLRFHRLSAVVVVASLLLLARLRRRRVHLLLLALLLRTATQLLIRMLPRISRGRVRVIRSYVFTQVVRVLVHCTALVTLQRWTPRTRGTDGTRPFRRKMLLVLIRMVPRVTSTATTTPAIVLRVFSRR